LLTKSSLTSARSETNGNGGLIKILGDKVGLFDQAAVDVSGTLDEDENLPPWLVFSGRAALALALPGDQPLPNTRARVGA